MKHARTGVHAHGTMVFPRFRTVSYVSMSKYISELKVHPMPVMLGIYLPITSNFPPPSCQLSPALHSLLGGSGNTIFRGRWLVVTVRILGLPIPQISAHRFEVLRCFEAELLLCQ